MHRCGVFCLWLMAGNAMRFRSRFPHPPGSDKIAADSHGRGAKTMTFLNAYFTAIDLVAIAAVVLLVIVAFFRSENVWLGLMLLVVVAWAGSAVLGYY